MAAWLNAGLARDPEGTIAHFNNSRGLRGQYQFNQDTGQFEHIEPSFIERNPWLIPVAGAGAGVGLGLAGVLGGAAAAGGSGASAAIPSSVPIAGTAGMAAAPAATGGVLASSVPVAGTVGMAAAPAAIGSTAAAAGTGTGFWATLANAARNPQTWQDTARVLSSMAQRADAQRQARMDREGESLRRMQQASYIANRPNDIGPSYMQAPSADIRQQADELQRVLMARLSEPTTPSLWERIAGYAAPAMSIYGLTQRS
jgi:hypothetical protein